MKVLIAGICGQDGFNLATFLVDTVKDCIIYGTYVSDSKIATVSLPIIFVKLDLTDNQQIEEIIRNVKPDYFVNFASAQPQFVTDEGVMFSTNTVSTLTILNCIRKYCNTCKYFSSGSSLEYGHINGIVKITDAAAPDTIYGISKHTNRMIIDMYRAKYQMFVVHGVFFNHDSPRRSNTFILKNMLTHLIQKKYMFIENINARKDWSDSRDFVKGVWRALNHKKSQNYIFSSGCSVSLYDAICIACDYLKYNAVWRVGDEFSELYCDDLLLMKGHNGTDAVLIGESNVAQVEPRIPFKVMITDMIDYITEENIKLSICQ